MDGQVIMRKNKKFSYDEIKALTGATYKLLDVAKSADAPNDITSEIQFLNVFLETLVERVLNDKSLGSMSKTEQFKALKVNFLRLKMCVQEATALAFQEPMRKFTKSDLEYYCRIAPVPQSSNSTTH